MRVVSHTATSVFLFYLPPTKEVCLSVCLSVSKITQKRVHGFGEMLRVDRCRDMDELINF